MKLLLHWLRWDLRRFRWPLLAWVALLAAFTVWLWHLNAHLLTVDVLLLRSNEVIAAVLGIFEFFLLLTILSSDPAAGARPFWKTRPPSGFAIAGAKLTLALFFFLALPLLCWWSVLKACGFEHDQGHGWGGITWMAFLWWANALVIGVLALVASGARNAGSAVARLLAAMAVLLAIGLLFDLAATSQFRQHVPEGPLPLRVRWIARVHASYQSPVSCVVWLLAGVIVFTTARRRRSGNRIGGMAHLFVPALAVAGGALVAEPLHFTPAVGPHPAPEQFAGVSVGQPALRGCLDLNLDTNTLPAYRTGGLVSSSLRLPVTGMPDDCLAWGMWTKFKLISESGREIEASRTGYPSFSTPNADGELMEATGAWFQPESLAALSMSSCRAEGIVRIYLRRRYERLLPLSPGASADLRSGIVHLYEINPGPDYATGWFQCRVQVRNFDPDFEVALLDPGTGRELPLRKGDQSSRGGYLLNYSRRDVQIQPPFPATITAPAVHYRRAAAAGRTEGWRLVFSWHEEEGWIERPVSIEQVIIPRQPEDGRDFTAIFDALTIPPDATQDAVRRQVQYALGLMGVCGNGVTLFPLERDPLTQAAARFLDKVPREHLDVLLRLAEENPPHNPSYLMGMDFVLRRRIVALLTPGDIPALRQKPRLLRDLKLQITNEKLVPAVTAGEPEWHQLSDEDLRLKWEESRDTPVLCYSALDYAARRGLPWVPAAITDVVDFMPASLEAREIVRFMSKLSDCPASRDAAIPWLQKNAARLTWDATTKRWVLP